MKISRAEFVALVAALGAINAAAIDVMLPALPAMGDAFGVANANNRSLVLTVFLIGLGLPQLVAGPISDRFGRRAPLMLGLGLYAAGAFAALFAPSFGALLALRFMQGLGSAAVAVSSQAAVRDQYSGRAMAEVMSLVWTTFMIVPIVAPFVGQVILLIGPWQYIFAFMGLVGLACLAWAGPRLPETLAPARRRPLDFRSVAEGFATVVGQRVSLFYGIAGMFMFGAILGLVNTSQQIYVDHFGMGAYFPFLFSVLPLSAAVAFFVNSKVVERIGMRRIAHGGMSIFLVVTGLWLIICLTSDVPLWLFLIFVSLTALSQGVAWGNIGALMMEPLGEVAGTATAVFGALSTVGAAIIGYVIAQSFDGTPTPVVAAFFISGLLIVGCFLVAERGRLFTAPAVATAPLDAS
jgi:DHA1 family bicyclomycin/chloramphenicol resistance-like MFS transporter